jgi:N-acetyltransferase 10
VSFGLTFPLLNFWGKKQFKVCYLRQTCNDLTGEYSCIALRELNGPSSARLANAGGMVPVRGWLDSFAEDYRKRLIFLMGFSFAHLDPMLAISLVDPERRLTTAMQVNIITLLISAGPVLYCLY